MRRFLTIFLLLLPLTATAQMRVMPFLPDSAHRTGFAVLVCPGGSYSWLGMRGEGTQVAEWLREQGINAYVLRYRVPTVTTVTGLRILGMGYHWPTMLTDVERGLQYIYEHAASDGVDTAKIGVLGFSAGGHLAVASAVYNRTKYRPHFVGAIYPVVTLSRRGLTHCRSRRGLLGWWGQFDKNKCLDLSLERHIPVDCPPVFIVACKDDPIVDYRNSLLLDSALTANKVPHQLLLYPTGGHSFGVAVPGVPSERHPWTAAFLRWIIH